MDARTEYLELIEKAKVAAKAYYTTGTEVMTDAEYDIITDRVEALSEEFGWTEGDILLDTVAAGQGAGGDVTHDVRMLSLAKANTVDTVNSFLSTVKGKVRLEPKLDGLAISAIYENGKLVQVATRGDGQTGEDLTKNIDVIKGLPQTISYTDRIEVRGEVFITSSDFITASKNRLAYKFAEFSRTMTVDNKPSIDELYEIASLNRTLDEKDRKSIIGRKFVKSSNSDVKRAFRPEKEVFANSRNAVAGALRNEDAGYVVPLTFACYDVLGEGSVLTDSYQERVRFIEVLGIKSALALVPGSVAKLQDVDVIAAVTAFGEARVAGLDYPTDGVVLKADSLSERKSLGEGSRSPKWAIAYKYASSTRESVVKEIELNIGRTGRLALRARINPVLVDGTEIQYVSLHNVSWTEEKDVRIGDTVLIRRANDVIPYLEDVVLSKRPATATRWEAPETCPQCGSEWDKGTLLWRCPSPSCGQLNGIIFAAGRDYFDWEGLSEAVITRLNDTGLVNNISDVFNLTEVQLANLSMGRKNKENEDILLGKTVAAKLYKQIQNSKKRPLSAVLAALGVRTLGRTFGRRLEAHYGDMGKIVSASVSDLTKVDGIAIKKAEIIHAGLQERLTLIQKLAEQGVTMTSTVKKPTTGNPFIGKKVVITGSVPGFTRGAAQEYLTEIGATASSSVSSNTDFLVADEESKGSSKYKKAESLGVQIISPEKFLELSGK